MRERITKTLDFTVEKSDPDEGTFEGFAAAYGNEDAQGDIIEYGAFAKTVREGSDRVRVYWQHDLTEPIGVPVVMAETPQGLFVKGKVSLTQRGRDALTLMRDGVVSELSIGAQVVKSHMADGGIRKLTELRLFDISLVSLAANPQAVITAVKDDHAALPATLPVAKAEPEAEAATDADHTAIAAQAVAELSAVLASTAKEIADYV
jgi:HK97 family phage prohead protease